MADIVGMIGTGFDRDPEIATQKGSTQLGNHLFHRIGIIAKAFAEGARQTVIGT